MSVWDSGAGRNKTLIRGVSNPSKIMSETFIEPNGESHAGSYTVQFSTRPVDGTVPDNQNPTVTYATITWAIGGQSIQRIVSVTNGQSVTGVGAGCVVEVMDDTDVLGSVPDPVPNYDVVCTLVPGTRGSSGNPPTYFPNTFIEQPSGGGAATTMTGSAGKLTSNLGGNNQAVIDVPKNAGAISVQVTVGSAAIVTYPLPALDVKVAQVDASGINVKVYTNSDYPSFVPLDPRTTKIVITNNGTVASPEGDAYWGICFGIDG